MVDDAKLSQKHVNLLQPVVFYAAREGGRPVELVINKVSKDHVHGYVRGTENIVNQNWRSASGNQNGASTTAAVPEQRQKLYTFPK